MGLFSAKKSKPEAVKKSTPVRIIDYPDIGEVRVCISRRARRINLSVKPDGIVRLAIPRGVPQEKGLQFLDSKKEWILRTRAKYTGRDMTILPPYSTRSHTLTLLPGEYPSPRVKISGEEITVHYPSSLSQTDPAVQKSIKKGIEEAWRDEAKEYLPVRLYQLSCITGLKYGSVTIRNAVSKWGSCSVRNDISLSLHLMRLPDHLIDYILLHELAHTVHKNHGPQFHELLDNLTNHQHHTLRTELKNYHTRW